MRLPISASPRLPIKVLLPLLAAIAFAQPPADTPYLNPDLSPEKRAADLVSRMTLEEKVLQMQNGAPALPRLNIPAYDWWNEALHGVARAGQATVFPQAIGLAATFDTDLMHRIADVISTEARAKYNEAIRNNNHGRYYGLTFWSPNINIFRDPRWGRGQETYGEDPYLTGRLAVAFITGMQGTDPHYFKVIATAKHYAVHSGPEPTRHQFDAAPSARDLEQTYLPAFRAAMVEAKADSIMCAYNRIDGVPACASTDLLVKRLRGEWNFQGYVVSDCGAIADIYRPNAHKYKATAAEASAVAVKAGTDLTCGTEYRSLVDAVKSGLIAEAEIDTSLQRLFVARFKLGVFDPPERVPWSKIPYSVVDSGEHRKLALEAARESIVLLKNDKNLLPIKSSIRKIAVIGPSADDEDALLGNYNGFSRHHVPPLEGLEKQFAGKAQIRYALGATYTSQTQSTIPAAVLDPPMHATAPGPGAPTGYSGTLRAPVTGEYAFSARSNGFRQPPPKVFVDEQEVAAGKTVPLEAGTTHRLRVKGAAAALWMPPADPLLADAIAAVKDADAAVAFIGLNPNLEGEEMRVTVPGFAGGDRTDLNLPAAQERLLDAAFATGKPVIVVLTSGSAVGINSAKERAAAILAAWYGGEEAGTAIAETLAGANNPTGRLPVTFYKSAEQLPPFDDYSMNGRTYRYFKGEPLWFFGYGLSYSKFDAATPRTSGKTVTVRVKNTSQIEGDEVVQLYHAGSSPDAPIRELCGFQRIHLRAGESRDVQFTPEKPGPYFTSAR
jgi:beta-glucosidase